MGSTFIRDNSWVIEYKVNGKTKRKSLGKKGVVTKTMAKEILRQREQQIKLGEYDLLEAKIPRLNEFANEYLNHVRDVVKKRSWKRDELCLKHLIPFFGTLKLSQIKPIDVDEYKRIRVKEVAPATVNRELEILRSIFNLAQRWNKFFGKNPVSQAGLFTVNNQKERILTQQEEQKLLTECAPYLRDIIVCALHTGMRKSEIIGLKWENVDLDTNFIFLEHTNTKSKKSRRLPINSTLRKLLVERRLQSSGSEYVFLNSDGNPYMRQDSLNRAFQGALKRANIQGLRFHDLRHSCATRMIERGASIVAVSRILGHSSLSMTMRYAHPENSLIDAVESLSGDFYDSVTDKSTDTALTDHN